MFGCQITEIQSQHFSHLQECTDHIEPDKVLHNTDSESFISSNQGNKIVNPAASASPEISQNLKSQTHTLALLPKGKKAGILLWEFWVEVWGEGLGGDGRCSRSNDADGNCC